MRKDICFICHDKSGGHKAVKESTPQPPDVRPESSVPRESWDRGELADLLIDYHKKPTNNKHFDIEDFIDSLLLQERQKLISEVRQEIAESSRIGIEATEEVFGILTLLNEKK